jgi:hypothetical protein
MSAKNLVEGSDGKRFPDVILTEGKNDIVSAEIASGTQGITACLT